MAYSIELFARDPIVFDDARLLAAMRTRLGNIEQSPRGDGGTLMFDLKDHVAQYADAAMPAQLVLLPAGSAPEPDKLADALQQSWTFADAATVVEGCRHCCLFADMMSGGLPQLQRRRMLAAGLSAVLETTRIDAVHFVETQQVLEPGALRALLDEPAQRGNPTAGFLNVRYFNISNSPGDMLMDTLGLAPFGLTDVQVHFRGMEPNDVAQVLRNTATYIFERGDVIASGHTVQGRAAEENWRCRSEESLLDPKRPVLDLDPGAPFAAGRRAA
jgi:hypothetical protein